MDKHDVPPVEPENLQDKVFALEKQIRELEEERDALITQLQEALNR